MSDSTLHPAHPEIELLAEHAEELLPPEQSAELAAHLDSCPECAETYAALAELTSLLGDEPTPGPMPDDVAARIDAALAAERENPTGSDAGGDAEAEEPAGGGQGDADRPPASRRPAGDRPADNRPRTRSRRSARVRRVLVTLALFAAVGGIGIAVSRGGDLDSGASNSSAIGGASVPLVSPNAASASAYDFTQANLSSEIQRLARDDARFKSATAQGAATPSGSPSGPGEHAAPNTGAQTVTGEASASPSGPVQPTAPSCVLAATKRTDQPAVQGIGRYLGVEVFALLYPDATDPEHRWDVYLVQDSCSAPLVMLHQSVPRA
ncbi:hypothetical protein [Streptacidiphilus jiangxiensis]|uniref:Zinc-finger n=1 Tax=Streptacidiphilus jiangxiensis TaxID=235985 RepID=A0A1H7JC26_STRJI|nr:hypothetical protein [Streptacidiphilus jiangxiensis]SEK71942.1 hypothetical protein SAMN05414137_103220 [Streptacidiphilus jiangxiensis]